MEELELGLGTAAGAALWALGIWGLVFIVELLWTLRLRRMLVGAGKPSLGATLGLVGVLVVVLPMIGGYAGCIASAQRSGADATEHVGNAVVEEIIDRTLDRAALELLGTDYDDELPIELSDLQTRAKAHQAREGLFGLFDAIVFQVIAKTTSPLEPPVTWRKLITHARTEVGDKIRTQLKSTADGLRSGARFTLLFFLAIALAINGAAYALIRRAIGTRIVTAAASSG